MFRYVRDLRGYEALRFNCRECGVAILSLAERKLGICAACESGVDAEAQVRLVPKAVNTGVGVMSLSPRGAGGLKGTKVG